MGTSSSYIPPTSGAWPAAKRLAGIFARQGGAVEGGVSPARVTAAYVQAHGGAGGAAGSATAGRAAAQRLGGFFGAVAAQGLAEALQRFGLAELVGRAAEDVIASLVDRLAGPGRSIEEAAARAAMLQVLQEAFQTAAEDGADVNSLAALDPAGVQRLLGMFLVEYVYQRMVEELGDRLLNGALTTAAVYRAEQDLRTHITTSVAFELELVDPVAVNWEGQEGEGIVSELLRSAYVQLEALPVSEKVSTR